MSSSAFILTYKFVGDVPAEVREELHNKVTDKLCVSEGHQVTTFAGDVINMKWQHSLNSCIISSSYDINQIYALLGQVNLRLFGEAAQECGVAANKLKMNCQLMQILQVGSAELN